MLPSEEIRDWVEELHEPSVVPLEQFTSLISWLKNLHHFPSVRLVIGCSGTGKTIAISYYQKSVEKRSRNFTKPTLLIKPPLQCEIRAFYLSLIKTLYSPTFGRISTYELRQNSWYYLKHYQVSQLIIDDADRLKSATFTEITDIVDRLKISVILVGGKLLLKKIAKNERIERRIHSTFYMNPLTCDQFAQAVFMLTKSIFRCEMDMSDMNFLSNLYSYCQGSIKILDETFRQIALTHLQNGLSKFSPELIKETFFSLRPSPTPYYPESIKKQKMSAKLDR